MAEWQPISEAPRDGTEVLLYGYYLDQDNVSKVEYVCLAWWYKEYEAWCEQPETFMTDEHFTHFQYLPTPPTKKES